MTSRPTTEQGETQRTAATREDGPRGGRAPSLSLLVCTLGRGEALVRLFTSLLAQTRRDFEVVLVDQNPPGLLDPSIAPFRDCLHIVHVRSAPGLSRARNLGLLRCSAPLIAFPDDDCWYPAGLVSDVVEAFDGAPGVAAFTGRTVDARGRDSLGVFLPADAGVDKRNVWSIGNSNSLFVRRDAARAVAGFDETLGVGAPTPFKSGEETDFLLRILATGREARYRRDLLVHHDQVPATDAATLARRAAAYSRGFGRLLRLHGYGDAYLAFRVCRTMAGACRAAARGDRAMLRYKAEWAWGTACGYLHPAPAVLHGSRSHPASAPDVADRTNGGDGLALVPSGTGGPPPRVASHHGGLHADRIPVPAATIMPALTALIP